MASRYEHNLVGDKRTRFSLFVGLVEAGDTHRVVQGIPDFIELNIPFLLTRAAGSAMACLIIWLECGVSLADQRYSND